MIIVLFVLWFFLHACMCPCDNKNPMCMRTEFYGFQYGHLFFFMLLGFLYPNDMAKYLTLGVLWEVFEYWLSMNPQLIRRFGGCLSTERISSPLWFKKVHGGEQKYENFIDRSLGIKNSPEHTWHYSVGENLTNFVGFLIGKNFLKILKKL